MRFILTFVVAAGILFGQDPAQKGKEAGKLTKEQTADLKLMEANFQTVQAELRAAIAEKKVAEQAVADANGRGQALIGRYQALKVVVCGGVKVPVDQCELDSAAGIIRKNEPAKAAAPAPAPAKPEPIKEETKQ